MKKFRKLFKFGASLVLIAAMFINSSLAQAADFTAASLSELSQILREQGLARKTNFSVEFTGSSTDFDYAFNDNMAIFYYDLATLDYTATSDDADYIVGNIDFTVDNWLYSEDNTLVFNYKYFENLDQTAYVNSKVPEILKSLGVDGMSNYEKVKTIHDYVCQMITYESDGDIYSTAYSSFANGKGLCNSYALCMYKLLVGAGIPCKWIGGFAGTGRDAGGHAWNIVALGDKWYYVDPTWDDDEDNNTISYDYFLKGTSDFDAADPSQTHKLEDCYSITSFLSDFPLAEKAFDPNTDSDVNTKVVIGNVAPNDEPVQTTEPIINTPEPAITTTEPYYDDENENTEPTQTPFIDDNNDVEPTEDPYNDDNWDVEPTEEPYNDDNWDTVPTEKPVDDNKPNDGTQTDVGPNNDASTPTGNVTTPSNDTATPSTVVSPSAATTPSTVVAPSTATTPITVAAADTNTTYKFSDFVNGKYPARGKFKLKRKKKIDLQLFIEDAEKAGLIKKVTYKITTGKKRVKVIKNYGVRKDNLGYFTSLYLKGKKKGTVKVKITLNIKNGQKLSYTFKGKVK